MATPTVVLHRKRTAPVPVRRLVALFLGVLVLTSAVTVGVTVSQRSLSMLVGETITVGSDLTYTLKGVDVVQGSASAAGSAQGSAIEMAASYGTARTALTDGNWKYVVEVYEASAGSIASGTYKVELFKDGVSQGALYMTQGTADGASVEGVTFSWDIGSSVSNAGYRVEVTAV